MSHPIVVLQGALVAALRSDAALTALVPAEAIADAPARGTLPPTISIARHDVAPRDTDLAPGLEHRLVLQLRHPEPSRKAVLGMVEAALAVVLGADLDSGGRVVTLRRHERTETAIDLKAGQAVASLALRFFTEPA